jgi:hypothetical protein
MDSVSLPALPYFRRLCRLRVVEAVKSRIAFMFVHSQFLRPFSTGPEQLPRDGRGIPGMGLQVSKLVFPQDSGMF